MNKQWQETLDALAERCRYLDDECLDNAAHRPIQEYAVVQHNGNREWIEFAESWEDAKLIADGSPMEESPWAATEIVALTTGARWRVDGYKADTTPL